VATSATDQDHEKPDREDLHSPRHHGELEWDSLDPELSAPNQRKERVYSVSFDQIRPWPSSTMDAGDKEALAAARRRRRAAPTQHNTETREEPYTTAYVGGPPAPLLVTPAGGAARGEGR
jgi:hypothetical protein